MFRSFNRCFPWLFVLVLRVSSTRTRARRYGIEYEYHFIEYEYDQSQNSATSKCYGGWSTSTMGSCGRVGQNKHFSVDTPVGKPQKLTSETHRKDAKSSKSMSDRPLQHMVLFLAVFRARAPSATALKLRYSHVSEFQSMFSLAFRTRTPR